MTRIIKWKSSFRTPVRFGTAGDPSVEDHYRLEITPEIIKDELNHVVRSRSVHKLYRNGELISVTREVNRLHIPDSEKTA